MSEIYITTRTHIRDKADSLFGLALTAGDIFPPKPDGYYTKAGVPFKGGIVLCVPGDLPADFGQWSLEDEILAAKRAGRWDFTMDQFHPKFNPANTLGRSTHVIDWSLFTDDQLRAFFDHDRHVEPISVKTPLDKLFVAREERKDLNPFDRQGTIYSGTYSIGSGGDYADFATFMADIGSPLTGDVIGLCSAAGVVETGRITVDNIVTATDKRIIFRATGTGRHSGAWTSSAYRLEVTNNDGIRVYDNHFVADGLQFKLTKTDNSGYYATTVANQNAGSLTSIRNCIYRGDVGAGTTGRSYGLYHYDADGTLDCANTLFYGFNRADTDNLAARGYSATTYFSFVTVYDCYTGLWGASTGTQVCQCCLVDPNSVSNPFPYINATGSQYNGYDGGGPGSNNIDLSSYTSSQIFTDASGGDFSAKSAGPAYQVGTSLAGATFPVTTDAIEAARPGSPCLGFIETGAGGGGITPALLRAIERY